MSEDQINIARALRDEYQVNFNFKFDVPLAILDKLIFNDVVNGLAVILIDGFEREVLPSLKNIKFSVLMTKKSKKEMKT